MGARIADCGVKRMRTEIKLAVRCTLSVVLISFSVSGRFVQQPEQSSPAQTTIRVQSSLVLVDVISQDPKNGLPVELTKEARGKHQGIRLKFRPEYIPVFEAPVWAR
jgi:hypothetical protein